MQRLHRILSVACLLLATVPGAAAPPRHIRDASVSPAFFNPGAGQKASITFVAGVRGTARVTILDRDRYPVRVLPPVAAAPGFVTVNWDGRDESGAVVPDEAWNVRIELAGQAYDPSLDFHPVSDDPQPRTYSRIDGVLSYRLTRPARVHIEAGQATCDPKTGRGQGPILKTIVNREPRVAGAVVEMWNGFDESGTIRVSALPNFVVSVLATSLPDCSIITRGNRRVDFLDWARKRRPPSEMLARKRPAPTHQHAGLNAFEDRSPSLHVKRTRTKEGALRMVVEVAGPTAAHFLQQPGRTEVFVDEKRVVQAEGTASPLVLTIPAKHLGGGDKRIAVNWVSGFGPAAAASFRLEGRP